MPAKQTRLSDAERAKRMRALGREVEAGDDPAVLDGALRKIVQHRSEAQKPVPIKK